MRTRLVFAALVSLGTLGGIALPAHAYTPVSEMKDVSPDHWAYQAIKAMVEKYQIMEGFPDNTFRGTRPISRYELASALSRLMTRIEEMPGAGGAAPERPSAVSADDLRTIARLQQEFKDELTAMKGRVDTLDQRVSTLEKRLRLSGSLEALYRKMDVQPLARTLNEADDLRIQTTLNLDADVATDLTYRGTLAVYNLGVQSFANGHLASDAGRPGMPYDIATPLYVRRSYFSWTPNAFGVHAGMMTLSDTLRVGSSLRNEFRTGPVWPNGEGGYGFVGTPPVQPQANGTLALTLVPVDAAAVLPTTSGRVRWNPGVNVVEDLLDPNSVWDVNTGSAPAGVVTVNYGPVEIGLADTYGTPGAAAGLALQDQPRPFPLIAPYGSGYGLLKLGVDLGVARWSAYGRADNAAMDQISNPAARGKGWGTSFDLGSDALGLNLSHAEMARRDFDPASYTETTAFVTSNDLFGTGIGLGVGAKLGNTPATDPTSRIAGFVDYDWVSTGAYVRVPGVSVIPSITLAAQESGPDLLATAYGSGLSLIVEFQPIPALPSLMIEYSQAHFYGTPSTALPNGFGDAATANQLLGGGPQTHEQIVVGTAVKF